jgi:hypothetical protein
VSGSRAIIENARVPTRVQRTRHAEPKPPLNIIQACEDPDIFGPWFKDRETWAAWFAFLRVMFGLQLSDAELAVFKKFTGREAP